MPATSTTPAPTPAEIILRQLGGRSRLSVMIGAQHFYGTEGSRALTFRFPNTAAGRPNAIVIRLDDNDTYTMRFSRVRGSSVRVVKEVSDVGVESLRRIFEETTGLRIAL